MRKREKEREREKEKKSNEKCSKNSSIRTSEYKFLSHQFEANELLCAHEKNDVEILSRGE